MPSSGVMRSSRSPSAITTRLPESESAYSISSVVHHAFIETEIAPIEVIAAKATTHSG